MSTSIPAKGDYFIRAVTAVAILGPILLVVTAGTLPEGLLMRGHLMVNGLIFIVAALASALVSRVVYAMGFDDALKNARARLASSPNHSLTA